MLWSVNASICSKILLSRCTTHHAESLRVTDPQRGRWWKVKAAEAKRCRPLQFVMKYFTDRAQCYFEKQQREHCNYDMDEHLTALNMSDIEARAFITCTFKVLSPSFQVWTSHPARSGSPFHLMGAFISVDLLDTNRIQNRCCTSFNAAWLQKDTP